MIQLGFMTGQEEIPDEQAETVETVLAYLNRKHKGVTVHHRGKEGTADIVLHDIATGLKLPIVVHSPPKSEAVRIRDVLAAGPQLLVLDSTIVRIKNVLQMYRGYSNVPPEHLIYLVGLDGTWSDDRA